MSADACATVVVGRLHHLRGTHLYRKRVNAYQSIGQPITNLVGQRCLDDRLNHCRARIDFAPSDETLIRLYFDQARILRTITNIRHIRKP